ncbi:helix-turn-helix domain-containing protein [Phytoactinopolyspora halotolerans]|uniref:Helix-turn-helix transcriptional regulator n=1 Tax=Phytoactinopolyspora halotolerans TaxID=1981512 RepID=A0A6L9S1R8_9ACTN|nr:helix-turn-helix transcriptional regulator [Phytoactinopolyspora halotolerans]NED98551.1 helix-turn-helix transcriptional regulator [Phytoactinopolyspora halotolerans]
MTVTRSTNPTAHAAAAVGQALRAWRERRRLTQLELSARAEVSTRHISFIETGRSTPTASMILRLTECLDVPLRDRNAMLLRAGFAPAYTQRPLTEPSLAVVNDAINRILDAHTPYPAVVVDRQWNLVAANDAIDLLTAGSADFLLEPPVNVLRLTLHPQGMAPRIVNLTEWSTHILTRLRQDCDATADPHLEQLLTELRGYSAPAPSAPASQVGTGTATPPALVVPMRLRTAEGVISLFSMTTVFGTPTDVTVSELAIESFYPEDDITAGYFQRQSAPSHRRGCDQVVHGTPP